MAARILHAPALALLYSVPRDYNGEFLPAVAEIRKPARLLHHRRVPGAVLANIDDNGVLRLLRLETLDHPELARLGDCDRALLQAAVMAEHREQEVGDAV